MSKATNCNEECSNYEYCEGEHNLDRFLAGSTCADFSANEDDEEEGEEEHIGGCDCYGTIYG